MFTKHQLTFIYIFLVIDYYHSTLHMKFQHLQKSYFQVNYMENFYK